MATKTKARAAASPKTRSVRNVHTIGSITSTRNAAFTAPGMSAKDGATVIAILQDRLTTLVDLSLTLKHIHWNVVGPAFIGVHKMLDPQYAGVQLMVDATAERMATLGGVPSGLSGFVVETRSWDDYALGRADSQSHLAALDMVYRGVIESHRDAIAKTEDADPVTQDMLIGQTGELEEYHWFVRTHLEDYAGGLVNAGATGEIDAARSAAVKTKSRTRTRASASRAR